jgi:hypothetical protein
LGASIWIGAASTRFWRSRLECRRRPLVKDCACLRLRTRIATRSFRRSCRTHRERPCSPLGAAWEASRISCRPVGRSPLPLRRSPWPSLIALSIVVSFSKLLHPASVNWSSRIKSFSTSSSRADFSSALAPLTCPAPAARRRRASRDSVREPVIVKYIAARACREPEIERKVAPVTTGLMVDSKRPLWVISGHRPADQRCPLCPRKRTFVSALSMSALCQ